MISQLLLEFITLFNLRILLEIVIVVGRDFIIKIYVLMFSINKCVLIQELYED